MAVVLSVVVLLLAVLVAGLLRSHADILKALHELGVGVGEPDDAGDLSGGHRSSGPANPVQIPFGMGPPLPGERNSTSAPTIAGVAPSGDALAVNVGGGGHLTLLAFLSSGCATCAGFWKAFQRPDELGLPARTRLVVVTKGPEMESPAEVASHVRTGLSVVMSTDAWNDYEVPGSPFFVLVEGESGRRVGEGVANHFHQVVELVRRAEADVRELALTSEGRAFSDGLDGPERELANDRELMAAGILPGDPSLYPSTLADVYGLGAVDQPAGASGPAARRADVPEGGNAPDAPDPTGLTYPTDLTDPTDPTDPTDLTDPTDPQPGLRPTTDAPIRMAG
ncbi:MAG TPA: hypothetical protein VND67_02765 [Acidimicrobiales bacterium]|nr:hypothetical protein [Acidimicrobiales bacterium]